MLNSWIQVGELQRLTIGGGGTTKAQNKRWGNSVPPSSPLLWPLLTTRQRFHLDLIIIENLQQVIPFESYATIGVVVCLWWSEVPEIRFETIDIRNCTTATFRRQWKLIRNCILRVDQYHPQWSPHNRRKEPEIVFRYLSILVLVSLTAQRQRGR